ncbi:Heterokaryon incompatibility protein 6 [Diaporthe amygdali]|uniref:Heterokaryon incompatibility protein 6 n=1 Tax=Phomopsis amygdali TaxID=1214568 RepID=UPI0022FF3FBC|nr:Heterokaryon incompatibility protein 6 [Diaporthe amygdali]KAJ0116046.1 Heterokaryon incompatibility protein 6 [Diaporthe amygdali]
MDDLSFPWAPFAKEEYVDMEAYKYTPISPQDEIRCLILEPGQDEDPLTGSIKTYKLTEAPEYEAISYAWGLPLFRSEIVCDGRQISITRTLRDSLRQCRLPNEQRVLWADSICINQDDKHEKSHQVRLMAGVYSQATQVLICLGPDDDDHAERAFSFIRDVNRVIEDQLRSCHGWDSFPEVPLTHPLLHDTRWESFSAFTKKAWFYRGWVIQEATLAPKAQVIYGRLNCDWSHVLRIFTWKVRRIESAFEKYNPNSLVLHIDSYQSRFKSEAIKFFPEHNFRLYSLPDILHCAKTLAFTDPRDRIYAFMGLPIAKYYRNGLEISYEATMLETYHSFARFCVDQIRDLELLHFVEHDGNTVFSAFPSWVPQWQTNIYRILLTRSWCAPIAPERMPVTTPVAKRGKYGVGYLNLKGMLIDSVAFASGCLNEPCSVADLAKVWAKFQEYEHRHSLSVHAKYPPVSAFLEAITCGRSGAHRNSNYEEAIAIESMYIQHLEGQLPVEHGPRDAIAAANSVSLKEDERLQLMHSIVVDHIHNHKITITQRGFYCLAPGVAEEGDLCYILYGTKTPFVLRKSEATGLYQLLGEAFMVFSPIQIG